MTPRAGPSNSDREPPPPVRQNPARSTRGQNGAISQLGKFISRGEQAQHEQRQKTNDALQLAAENPMAPGPTRKGRGPVMCPFYLQSDF